MRALALLPLFLHPLALPASQAMVATRPSEVTVFPQGARVQRSGSIALEAGEKALRFPGLPLSLDEGSLRLSLKGPAGTRLLAVRLAKELSPQVRQERLRSLKEKVQALEDQKADLGDKVQAREAEAEILKGLGKAGSQQAGAAAFSQPKAAVDLAGAAAAVGRRLAALAAENRRDQRAMRKLDEDLSAAKRELDEGGRADLDARTAEAEVELKSAGELSCELSYLVPEAGWTPLYDLRLEGGAAPKVQLAFAGEVRQSTGEDWKGVKLALSTARPNAPSQAPDPTDWWLDWAWARPYAAQPLMSKARRGLPSAPAAAEAAADMASPAPAPESLAADSVAATTALAEYSALYTASRAAEVPSDGTPRRIGLSSSSHPAELTLVTVPRLAAAAYIQAKVKYEGQQALIPGRAQLFRGLDYAGEALLKPVAPGEAFEVGFGVDELVKVERKALDLKGKEGGLFTKGARRYDWLTTVKNFHEGPRVVEVREQLPRPRQSEIKVGPGEGMQSKALPEDPEKPGLMRWRLELGPKEEGKVRFSYEVKYPSDRQVSGLE